ncbi:MAG: nuclear transport factor 2 family protein [Pseudomonadota bacterium]|nr:nuclear transport factor 2 family protein [Pseudomonadota bacterium]
MSPADNKRIIQEIFAALGRGDAGPYRRHLHEDVVMRIMGRSSWSQTVRGKDRILRDYFGHVHSRTARARQSPPFNFLADADWVVVEQTGDMVSVDGRPYRNDYCLMYRLADGVIVEMKEYMDAGYCEQVLGAFPEALKAELQRH